MDTKFVEQIPLETAKYAGMAPLLQPSPAGDAATAEHFGGEITPGDAGSENEDNAP